MASSSRITISPKGGAPGQAKVNPDQSRKLNVRKIAFGVSLAFLSIGLLRKPISHCYQRVSEHLCSSTYSVEERAQRLLSANPLIDGHVDFPMTLRYTYGNHLDNDDFARKFENGQIEGHVDLARLRAGRSGGAFWSVFAPCPENGTDFSDENYAASVQFTLHSIDQMKRIFAAYPESFADKVDAYSALDAFRSGKLISPLGVEGLHQIGNSAANLRMFYDLGARYVTLTHNCHNKFADAALVGNPLEKSTPLWGGVSPLGHQLIHEMNRIGMIVDLSHVSEDTMVDILGGRDGWEGSRAPVIFSHSSAWSICPHPRNVKDSVLQLVKERNSVVMVNIAPAFISCVDSGNENGLPDPDPENATLNRVVEHIMHIGDLIGYDYVGIGTDFDGIDSIPRGFEDVSKYPDLVAELLRRGVSDADAAKIVGGNVIRVWKAVDAVAARMKAEGAPIMEDDL